MIRSNVFPLLLLLSMACVLPALAEEASADNSQTSAEESVSQDDTQSTNTVDEQGTTLEDGTSKDNATNTEDTTDVNTTETASTIDAQETAPTENADEGTTESTADANTTVDNQAGTTDSAATTDDNTKVDGANTDGESKGFFAGLKDKCALPTLSDSHKTVLKGTAGVGIAALVSYACYHLYKLYAQPTDYDLLLAAEVTIDQTSQDIQKMEVDHRTALALVEQNADPEAITQALHQTIRYEISPKPFVVYVNQLESDLDNIANYKKRLMGYKNELLSKRARVKSKETNENNTNLIKEFDNTLKTIKPLVEQLHSFAQKLYVIQTYATRTPEYVQEHILERIELLENKLWYSHTY